MGKFFLYVLLMFLLTSCVLDTTNKADEVEIPLADAIGQQKKIPEVKSEQILDTFPHTAGQDEIDKQIQELKNEMENAEITRVGDEIKITFHSQILFESNSAILDPSSEKVLNELSAVLNKYPGTMVEVTGHTDNVGDETYNLELSRKRAASVARYAVKQGVNPTRFRIKGFGESMPIASNNTEEGRSLNRRVEVSIKGNKLLNKNIVKAYNSVKDSACFCIRDEYQNVVCKRLCDSWMKVPASALSYSKNIIRQSSSLKDLLVSSDKMAGVDFLVSQDLNKKLEENDAIILTGKVLDNTTREPFGAKVIVKSMETGEIVAELESDAVTGAYSVLLERGEHYSISVEKKGFLLGHDNIRIPKMQGYIVVKEDLELTPLKAGQKINLQNVFFEQSKAVLLESSYDQLNEVVKLLNDNPTLEIELHGHTDGIGDPQLNFVLSEERVATIKKYLISKGIEDKRILVKAFGGTKPIASNDSEETRKLNRRVEFVVVKF